MQLCSILSSVNTVPVMFADMVEAHHAILKTFASQHDIAAILVEGVPRAFCAGNYFRALSWYPFCGTSAFVNQGPLHARSMRKCCMSSYDSIGDGRKLQ